MSASGALDLTFAWPKFETHQITIQNRSTSAALNLGIVAATVLDGEGFPTSSRELKTARSRYIQCRSGTVAILNFGRMAETRKSFTEPLGSDAKVIIISRLPRLRLSPAIVVVVVGFSARVDSSGAGSNPCCKQWAGHQGWQGHRIYESLRDRGSLSLPASASIFAVDIAGQSTLPRWPCRCRR